MKFTQASIHSFRPPTGKADHIEWDDAMPGFGIRHRQGGHGAYLVQYKIGEQTRRQSLGRVSKVTLEAARVLARRYFADVADKVDPALKRASKVASASVSIEALITSYLERQARAGCKPRTIDENRMYLSKHWKEIKGDPIKSIDRASVAR